MKPSVARQLRAIGPLPGVVAIVVPALLVWRDGEAHVGWGAHGALAVPPVLLGAALIVLGFALWLTTVRLFARQGEGTLAPWDPPRKLVVEGPYRRFRHPMIAGVAAVLLGEAALLGSTSIAIWAAGFIAVNAVYLPLVEEPRLVRRFGADYERYMREVPRWLPARRPHPG